MTNAQNYQSINKALWTARTKHHINTEFYDLDSFKKGKTSLDEIVLTLLPEIEGKDVLHLQCHFGQDTLSLSRMGARAVGLDFVEASIMQAEALAKECGLDTSFICSDVYEAPEKMDHHVDVVFTSYGVLGWLPDIKRWAQVVSDCLKPGGELLLVEFHPVVWMFNSHFSAIEYSYFDQGPIVETDEFSYTDNAEMIALPSVNWNHALTDVVNALLEAGMEITLLNEYDYSPYPCFQNIVAISGGKWQIKELEGKLPMVFAIKAKKK